MKATLVTIFRAFGAIFTRYLPFLDSDSNRIEDILNYIPIEGVYTTSGQPNERQLQLIHEAGFDTVINLAPTSVVMENSVVEERQILENLGVQYIHHPIDFLNPTDEDYSTFVDHVRGRDPNKLWVHCAINARVSAFTYRYRRDVLGEDKAAAQADLDRIWSPMGVWKRFLE